MKINQLRLFLIKKRKENKSDDDIVRGVVYDLCNQVIRNNNLNKKVLWNKQIVISTAYTYNKEEYDRKMNPIDFRLFSIPKNIRILGDFEFAYGKYFLIKSENDNSNIQSYLSSTNKGIYEKERKTRIDVNELQLFRMNITL
jgi:hypothetical protein